MELLTVILFTIGLLIVSNAVISTVLTTLKVKLNPSINYTMEPPHSFIIALGVLFLFIEYPFKLAGWL